MPLMYALIPGIIFLIYGFYKGINVMKNGKI